MLVEHCYRPNARKRSVDVRMNARRPTCISRAINGSNAYLSSGDKHHYPPYGCWPTLYANAQQKKILPAACGAGSILFGRCKWRPGVTKHNDVLPNANTDVWQQCMSYKRLVWQPLIRGALSVRSVGVSLRWQNGGFYVCLLG